MFKNFQERLTRDFRKVIPQQTEFNIVAPPERLYRHVLFGISQNFVIPIHFAKFSHLFSCWAGGSIMAISGLNFWISKDDYDEVGPTVIHPFCNQ